MRQQRWRAGNSPPDTTVTAGSWCRVACRIVSRANWPFFYATAVSGRGGPKWSVVSPADTWTVGPPIRTVGVQVQPNQ